MFAPKEGYDVEPRPFELRDIREYPDMFILRPPYQRHSRIWKTKMKEGLLDSICRKYYIPKLVLRRVRLDGETVKFEVIDGQQRLSTVLEFFDDSSKLRLPSSLMDFNPELPGKKYCELSPEKRMWFDKELRLNADVIKNIEDKTDPDQVKTASDLFWRLQQGEPLRFIEKLHSRLYSNVRNFTTKYSDTSSFNYSTYEYSEENPDRHKFFSEIIDVSNDRMQHILLLTRFLMIEFDNGATEVGQERMEAFFEDYPAKTTEAIDKEFENKEPVKSCISNLNTLYQIYKENPIAKQKAVIPYLKKDYYLISLYILLRHLKKYYVFQAQEYERFDNFSRDFYQRITARRNDDILSMRFRDNRQQTAENLETRDQIIRQIFFEQNSDLILKDSRRSFNESERIKIYFDSDGICPTCMEQNLRQGLSKEVAEEKSRVAWKDFEADHILAWIKGGRTAIPNAQLLCRTHNRQKNFS